MKKKNNIHYDILVRGKVQGVGFRYTAQNLARTLGLTGYVKNLPNGDVYLEIEGSSLATEQMLSWCKSGPGPGHVDEIRASEGELKDYRSFELRY